ncbi:hypothetical protein [Raoultella ornithinolytica]|uniref:hypothetical protein n=1 Tax=Raoultella ornithinolytica TaxID=54291 RepID=UPI00135D8F28|nr:hypothetical protein [Raoultella ornithinolytica]MCF6629497.1 hypothetical protein [Raoultella ornithinolytica]MCF6642028.1 hypothetical protein [Raoultella ornithinolytica]MCF6647694.1 hypothetical protein [Raoultella ornithinolytica]MCF6665395.1 hypothetical protein [Raoultella ornithinolytica]MCF6678560.1 hypothetical protein [Raoultella ornithinolytica]
MENVTSYINIQDIDEKIVKHSEDPTEGTHTKKTRKSRNARYKSKTESIHEKSGFTTLKLRVGQDVMQKLEEIYRDHRGYELNETRKDLDALSKIVSYCVSKFYKEMYLQKKKGSLPDILPAKTPRAQELYDLHQAVAYRALSGLPHQLIAIEMQNDRYQSPANIIASRRGSRKMPLPWDVSQVDDLLNIQWVNREIEALNKKGI